MSSLVMNSDKNFLFFFSQNDERPKEKKKHALVFRDLGKILVFRDSVHQVILFIVERSQANVDDRQFEILPWRRKRENARLRVSKMSNSLT
jgi:hypothetical protein